MGVGARLAATLPAGAVLLLHGPLGAGKTALVRGLAIGLGLRDDDVSSPTFTLVHEYRGGRVTLYHVDLYRLSDGAMLEDLGLDEMAADGILAVEWPERLGHVPPGALHVRLEVGDDDLRTISVGV